MKRSTFHFFTLTNTTENRTTQLECQLGESDLPIRVGLKAWPAVSLQLRITMNSGPRMCRVVCVLQPFGRDMRVDLRRDEMRVAEQFLHASQIRARVQ